MATGQKSQIERALQTFTTLANDDVMHFYCSMLTTMKRDNVGIILGLARAYVLLKNSPKARHQLKRVASFPWESDQAEDFESAWLLLADIHISSNKFDLAQEQLKKVLQHNKV